MAHYAKSYDVKDVVAINIQSTSIREFRNACKLRPKYYQAFNILKIINTIAAPAAVAE